MRLWSYCFLLVRAVSSERNSWEKSTNFSIPLKCKIRSLSCNDYLNIPVIKHSRCMIPNGICRHWQLLFTQYIYSWLVLLSPVLLTTPTNAWPNITWKRSYPGDEMQRCFSSVVKPDYDFRYIPTVVRSVWIILNVESLRYAPSRSS